MGRAALLESLHFSAGDIFLNVVQWYLELLWLWEYSEYILLLDIAVFIRKVQFLFHLLFHLTILQGSISLFIFLPSFSFFYLVLLSTFCLNCWGFCQLICSPHMFSVSLDFGLQHLSVGIFLVLYSLPFIIWLCPKASQLAKWTQSLKRGFSPRKFISEAEEWMSRSWTILNRLNAGKYDNSGYDDDGWGGER